MLVSLSNGSGITRTRVSIGGWGWAYRGLQKEPVSYNEYLLAIGGAELRDRLTMGQKREDILAGLHRAIILRAMALLARSGGIADEFEVDPDTGKVDVVDETTEAEFMGGPCKRISIFLSVIDVHVQRLRDDEA